MSLIKSIKEGEGFEGMPYKDHLGFDTIGYGTKLPLDEEEAELLLNHRLDKTKSLVESHLNTLSIPKEAWNVLYEMSYQMGVTGMLKFKNMIRALKHQDYIKASEEMLNSKWSKQTPNRAKRLSDEMKNIN